MLNGRHPKPKRKQRIVALDSETTGVDLKHGACPFLVTVCENGENAWWEWEVDPLTRKVRIPTGDLREIQDVILGADVLIGQNIRFDYRALQVAFKGKLQWDWEKVEDTLISGHLLASNQPHDLTSMVLVYLHVNIQPLEDAMEVAVKAAKAYCKREHPDWRLAKKGLPEMPSAKEKTWKYDSWLPALLADECEEPSWKSLTADYANADSSTTLTLWHKHQEILQERKLVRIYKERLKLLPIVSVMENRGVTLNDQRLQKLRKQYEKDSLEANRTCVSIAAEMGYSLTLPKSGNNGSLHKFIFESLKLGALNYSEKTGKESLDKATLEHWELALPPESKASVFVKALRGKRKRDTSINYLDGYTRFWLPIETECKCNPPCSSRIDYSCGFDNWRVLYPSLNPTGSDTLRFSSSNPNSQNVSKGELDGYSLRYCFGPLPGREWWSLDYQNLELRIPSYEAGEKDAIWVFEHPDDPPYYGSYHLLVAELLHPKEFKEHGKGFKDKFKSTFYQWVKNGNFAVIYGAQEGTADLTYHVRGAYEKIQKRFPKIAALSQKQIALAGERGYVETMPDKTVDPERGYPILCSRSRWGSVSPTIPLNYHVQGTAMWVTMKAMIRCHEYLSALPDHHLTMQVHDEIVFDLPQGGNTKVVRRLRRLMEMSGEDIGVPTPVSAECHSKNWSEHG